MSRYIDAIKLIEKWEKECGRGTNNGICEGDCFECQFPAAIDDLKDAPTIDAVPVVRCLECRHNKGEKVWRDGEVTIDCDNGMGYPPPNFFCADGERRTDG